MPPGNQAYRQSELPDVDTADVRHLPPSGKRFAIRCNFNHTVSVHTEGKEYKLAEDLIFIGPGDGTDNYYNIIVETHAADGTSIHKSGNAGNTYAAQQTYISIRCIPDCPQTQLTGYQR